MKVQAILFFLIVLTLSFSILSIPTSFAEDITISWIDDEGEEIDEYFITDGAVKGPEETEDSIPIILNIFDPEFERNGIENEIINATVKSGKDPTDILLFLIEEKDSGSFKNKNLILVEGEESIKFRLNDVAKIEIIDPSSNSNSLIQDIIENEIKIVSESDPEGIVIDLIETESNSNTFTAKFKFSNEDSDPENNIIEANEGDIITAIDIPSETFVNGLIISNPVNNTINAIFVEVDDEVTATYMGMEAFFTVEESNSSGRGPDGSNSLGLGSAGEASLVGRSCRGDCTPPTLGVYSQGKRIVDNGFSYNGNAEDVEYYYTPYPLITANVGEENTTVLKIYEDQGPQHIKHVELAFGLGEGEIISDSKAVIEWDRKFDGTETVTVFDPENALENVRVEAETGECGTSVSSVECLIATIYHTFREPLDFNMVGTYVWDFRRNGWQNYYNHGIEIVGESMNPPKQFQVIDKGYRINVIQTDKTTGIDENGYVWNFDSRTNSWKKDYVHNHREMLSCDESIRGYERHCIQFAEEKTNQENIAKNTMNEILVHEIIYWEKLYDPVPTPQGKHLKRSEDPVLQNAITYEMKRAQEVFDIKYDLREDQLDVQ